MPFWTSFQIVSPRLRVWQTRPHRGHKATVAPLQRMFLPFQYSSVTDIFSLRRSSMSYMTYALPSCFMNPLLHLLCCCCCCFILIIRQAASSSTSLPPSLRDASHCLHHHWLSALVVGIKMESERGNGNVQS
jgi:hypothetical protein